LIVGRAPKMSSSSQHRMSWSSSLRAQSAEDPDFARSAADDHASPPAASTKGKASPSLPRDFSKAAYPHVRQRYDWDCGLACCQMCLKWVNRTQTFSAITKRCRTQSTWSIDLAYLLHGYGITARYYTITWGANESYKSIDYYKENLDNDASRVNELFQMAASRGLHVEMRSVTMEEILATASKETCVVIMLVDTQRFETGCAEAGERIKKREQSSRARGEAARGKAKPKSAGFDEDEEDHGDCLTTERMPHSLPSNVSVDSGFVGHYVVLVRALEEDNLVEVCDPGVVADRRVIDRESLDQARKAHGTDEDILVIDVASIVNKRGWEDEEADDGSGVPSGQTSAKQVKSEAVRPGAGPWSLRGLRGKG